MLKDVKQFEQEIEGKIGRFLVEYDTPIAVAKEMLFQFLKLLGQIEDNYKAQVASQETAHEKIEENNLKDKFEAE